MFDASDASQGAFADGSDGPFAPADDRCGQAGARDNSGSCEVVLSTDEQSAKNRLNISTPIYRRPPSNTNQFPSLAAQNASDLWDGDIENPIQYDEEGQDVSGNVWTGTTESGDFEEANGSVRTSNSRSGQSGISGRTDSEWVDIDST